MLEGALAFWFAGLVAFGADEGGELVGGNTFCQNPDLQD
jgi:hypothetical protein